MPVESGPVTLEKAVLSREALPKLVEALQGRGYEVWGPTAEGPAIVYAPIETVEELPIGISDEQAPGKYRLTRRGDEALFQYASTPQSWKRLLQPPVNQFLEIRRENGQVRFVPMGNGNGSGTASRRALLGVRACDLAAIHVLDRVFLHDRYPDQGYAARRENLFVVAVNCGYPSGTCFCVSMGTGPEARGGYDLALTEILVGEHRFVVTVGSEAGAEVLAEVEHRPAEAVDRRAEENVLRSARESMGRTLHTENLREAIQKEIESKQWDEVGARCMSCANCTMACPTCFCMTVEDANSLDGNQATRTRVWDSCFTLQYSYIHGGSVRASAGARYRQWLSHKLSTWHDQFGSSGCVGCGRCITWCPVGIDITMEAEHIRSAASWGGI